MEDKALHSGKQKNSSERKLYIAFFLVVIILIVIFCSFHRNRNIQKEVEKWVYHTKEVLQQSEKINTLFKEVESCSRGYIITGWESFNETFVLTIKNLHDESSKLKKLTSDNLLQQNKLIRLDSIIEGKIAFAQALVKIRRDKGFEEARQKMQTGEGVHLTNHFTALLDAVQKEENRLLEIRNKENELSNEQLSMLLPILYSVLFLVTLSGGIILMLAVRSKKQANAKLMESREWFRKTLSGIGDGVIATNESGAITFMNPVAEDLTGWKFEEAEGKPMDLIFDIINEYNRKPVENPVKIVIRDKKIVELANHTILLKKDRTEVHIDDSAAPIFNSEDELVGVVLVFRDVEKQRLNVKLMEEEVEKRTAEAVKAEQRFRYTLDNMLEGAQIINKDFRYVYVNNSLEKMAHYKKEELIGFTMMEKYPGIEQSGFFESMKNCMVQKVPAHMENEFTFPDGKKGVFELSIQPVPEGVFILSIDITERKKIEWELKQLTNDLEKKVEERTSQLQVVNAELESFSYSVSHDLRAPLRAIDGYTRILAEDYGHMIDDEGKRIMKVITNNARQMGQLIDDLLSFSRVGKHDLIKVDLEMNSLVKSVVDDQLQKNEGRKINMNVKPLEPAHGDHSMIKLVMTNLISNAIKYSSKKETAEIEIGSYQEKDSVVYYVKDKGAGFDMNYYNKLFGVFQRLHNPREFEGTGVGLALVQRIILKHNGKVWAKGKEDEGATFYVSLPK